VSFDVVVLQPNPGTQLLESLEGVSEAFPLGTPQEIRTQLGLAVPGIKWSSDNFGIYEAAEGFALELTIPDETGPSSLHLSLHFGQRWEEGGSAAFDRLVRVLYESHRWQSFAVPDNSSLLLEAGE
jgi:hypothetical protein